MDLRLDSELEGGPDLFWSYLLDLSFSPLSALPGTRRAGV